MDEGFYLVYATLLRSQLHVLIRLKDQAKTLIGRSRSIETTNGHSYLTLGFTPAQGD